MFLLLLTLQVVAAYDNAAPGSRLPVMGWSSWVALGPGASHPIFDYCDEFSVKAASDAFVSLGFKQAGYTGFHLDDCWANLDRNATGYLQGQLDHFPNGMKPVVDHVHSNGMDFGLYTCAGSHTCVGGRPGSGGATPHWQQDADVFAEWGVDWVKQDNCNTNNMGQPEDYYTKMSQALNATGRPICFAMCEWGVDKPWKWGNAIAQSWRMHDDHTGVWKSTKEIIAASAEVMQDPSNSGVPFGWNDMDMLETGNYAQAAHANGKESTMTATEYKTEFSMWAISASPLVVTTPIMNCSTTYKSKEPPLFADTLTKCNIKLKHQLSKSTCVEGISFGCSGNQSMWTDKGCRGIFVVDGAAMECDMTGPGKHFCGDVQCVPWISSLQKEILFNTDIIGINQDVTPQGAPVVLNDLTVWSRKLTGGDVAVALYNQDDTSTSIGFTFDAVGFVGDQGKKTCVRDLWKHVDVSNQIVGNRFPNATIEPHAVAMYRVSSC